MKKMFKGFFKYFFGAFIRMIVGFLILLFIIFPFYLGTTISLWYFLLEFVFVPLVVALIICFIINY